MKKLEKQFWRRYKLLCLARILLVLIPQTGYIHPDEYFQSIEILAGDAFELDSNRPWEFNVTFPIRSISIPYFTVGLSYSMLKVANMFIYSWFETTAIIPYVLLVIPRLFMCLMSFLCDYWDLLRKLFKRKYHLLPTIRSVKGLMVVSMLTPLFLLSAFAHQEPRFIIPIIFPMVYLYAQKIYEDPDFSVIEAKDDTIKPKTAYFTALYIREVYTLPTIIFRKNMPYTMLLQPKPDKLFYSKTSKYTRSKRVFLYEEGSKDLHELLQKITAVLQVLEAKKVRNRLLYILPSSLDRKIDEIRQNHTLISIKKIKTLYPHLNMKSLNFEELVQSFYDIFKSFGLSIYTVNVAN
ncbi:hypothetical protein Trydic_g9467 [Trypoxylus dichotomus]